ncbi:MAG: hypothetical protein ABIT96_01715 [Ferruginibacter sp.]
MQIVKNRNARYVIFSALVFSLIYLVSLFVLKKKLVTEPVSYAAVALSVISFGAFIFFYIKDISRLDEVQVRIHMEAVVIGFALAVLLLMTLAFLSYIKPLNVKDWGYGQVMHISWLLYFTGLCITKYKYR